MNTEDRIKQLREELVSAKRLMADAAEYLHRRNLGQTAEDLKIKLTDKLAEINAVLGEQLRSATGGASRPVGWQ